VKSDDGQTGGLDERKAGSDGRIEDTGLNGMGGRMNNIRACAEEIVLKEIVCE